MERHVHRLSRVAGASLSIMLLGCTSTSSELKVMRTELDVFSGRPNPAWELSDDEAREFARLHAQLAVQNPPRSLPDGLGYRGFKVEPFQSFAELIVWKDVVAGKTAGQSVQWSDPSRTLEGLLLQSARSHLDATLFSTVQALVNAP